MADLLVQEVLGKTAAASAFSFSLSSGERSYVMARGRMSRLTVREHDASTFEQMLVIEQQRRPGGIEEMVLSLSLSLSVKGSAH